MIKGDVTQSMLHWPNSGTLPQPLNHTFIILIPKVKNPKSMSEYHPINLCNVLYKIFSKVLTNRLKKFLPSIITKHQSAFVKDHLITNNILISFENLHCMKNYKSGSSSYMALKLDMTKFMIGWSGVSWTF